MMQPIPARRAIWLMAKMRVTRLLNQASNHLARGFGKKKATARAAVGGKRRNLWLMTVVMALLMSFSFVNMQRGAMLNMQCHLTPGASCEKDGKYGERRHQPEMAAQQLHAAPFSPELMTGLTMELSILFLVSLLIPLASKELAQPDWDLEWLVTMPVRRGTLLWGRVLERCASNVTGLFALVVPLVVVAWYSGFHWSALPVALLGAAALLPLASVLQTVADTGLRMWLPASQLRNLQAVVSLISMPLLYLVMALGMPRADSFVMRWAGEFPSWTLWTPPGLVLRAIQAHSVFAFASVTALLLAQAAIVLAAGMALLRWQLSGGVVSSSARESARKPRRAAAASAPAAAAGAGGGWLSTIQRRELRLLSRDRNFLVQTLLLPVIIIGSQIVFNGQINSVAELGRHPTLMAAMAFGIGVYVLMLSAFQTLNNEGQVLWMLYTFPRPLESVLKEKAQLWAVLALAYPLAVFGIGLHYGADINPRLLVLMLTVLAGIPVFAVIAVALGVFASDPQAADMRNRVRPTYIYLYMLLSAFYTYSIYTSVWSQKLVVLVLTGALALALWQKARDELPYLLDPAASPPPRVSTSDGLMAATMFFVLQALGLLLFARDARHPGQAAIMLAFAGAGAITYALTRLVYWRSRTQGVPAVLRGAGIGLSLRWGLALGAAGAALALGYMTLLHHTGWMADQMRAAAGSPLRGMGLFVLAVVVAPLCEEFIFRGLIFGGLRRSLGLLPAMAVSAAVFAIMHPVVSMAPVFVLGLLTAWAYERSKTLLAPMLAHALYNGVLVGLQLWT
jgi:membrane protease YdiL (CAAX protease family)